MKLVLHLKGDILTKGFMRNLRAALRLFFFTVFISLYLALAALGMILFHFFRRQRHFFLAKNVSWFCWLGTKIFNIKIHVDNYDHVDLTEDYLLVGNHLSYVDIIALSSIKPTLFVTSREMQKTPGLGTLCEMAGCVFVDRRSKQNLRKEIQEIIDALNENSSVTFFPEATSTNGEALLKFRLPLFEAAVVAKKPVLPFCINYLSLDGKPITKLNRDEVFWYGDMTFGGHFWNFLKNSETTLMISFFHPIDPYKINREDLCQKSFAAISSCYRPVVN